MTFSLPFISLCHWYCLNQLSSSLRGQLTSIVVHYYILIVWHSSWLCVWHINTKWIFVHWYNTKIVSTLIIPIHLDHFYIIYLSCLSCHIFYDFFLKNWHFCELIMFQKLLELFKFRTNFSFWMFPSHLFKWSLLSSPLYYLGITKVSSQFIRHLKIYFEFSCNILVINVLSGLFQHVSYSYQAVGATWD